MSKNRLSAIAWGIVVGVAVVGFWAGFLSYQLVTALTGG